MGVGCLSFWIPNQLPGAAAAVASAASTNQTEQQELTSRPGGFVKPQLDSEHDTGLNGLRPSMAVSLNTKASCLLGRASATFCLGISHLSKQMKTAVGNLGKLFNC